jgi:hypothetical protein
VRISATALLGLLVFTTLCSAGPLRDQVITPSVEVETLRSAASGTLIRAGKTGLVLTNAHVVRGDFSPTVRFQVGKKTQTARGRVLLYDADRDLALVGVEAPSSVPAATVAATADYEEGDDIWYCGFGGGFSRNLQKSIINRLDEDTTWVNGGGWYGHSGSGLFRKVSCCCGTRYELIGVVKCGYDPIRWDGWRLVGSPQTPVGCVTLTDVQAFLKLCKGGIK